MKGGIDKAHSQNSDRLLLQLGSRIEKVDVQEYLVRLGARLTLETNAEPSVLLVCTLIVAGCNRVGEDEEARIPASKGIESIKQQLVLMVEHVQKTLFRDIARARTVD